MDDNNIKHIPINELRQEDGASELASSPDMEPYLEYIMAAMRALTFNPTWKSFRNCHSKNGTSGESHRRSSGVLADFDDFTVAADRDTLNPEDFAKVMDLLRFRPIQFCIFLKALVGAEEMKKMMLKAILFAGRSST